MCIRVLNPRSSIMRTSDLSNVPSPGAVSSEPAQGIAAQSNQASLSTNTTQQASHLPLPSFQKRPQAADISATRTHGSPLHEAVANRDVTWITYPLPS